MNGPFDDAIFVTRSRSIVILIDTYFRPEIIQICDKKNEF